MWFVGQLRRSAPAEAGKCSVGSFPSEFARSGSSSMASVPSVATNKVPAGGRQVSSLKSDFGPGRVLVRGLRASVVQERWPRRARHDRKAVVRCRFSSPRWKSTCLGVHLRLRKAWGWTAVSVRRDGFHLTSNARHWYDTLGMHRRRPRLTSEQRSWSGPCRDRKVRILIWSTIPPVH